MTKISITIEGLSFEEAQKVSHALAQLGLSNAPQAPQAAPSYAPQAPQAAPSYAPQAPQAAPSYEPQAPQPNIADQLKAAVQSALNKDHVNNGLKLQQLCRHYNLRGVLDAKDDPALANVVLSAIQQM
jgi:hypothetical protein